MVAAMTPLPVLGVPVESRTLKGQDSLLSIVQMPAGVPVGTLAIGEAGATNAGLLAVQILALADPELAVRLDTHRANQTAAVAVCPRLRHRADGSKPISRYRWHSGLRRSTLSYSWATRLKTHVYCDASGPAFDVATAGHGEIRGSEALQAFARSVDAVTYEFENIPLRRCASCRSWWWSVPARNARLRQAV
jgi:hypothetical protein